MRRSLRLVVPRWLTAGFVGLTLTAAAGAANAASCGDTIGPGGMVTLDSDVICQSTPATHKLLVTGPVTLDLNGRTIDCGGVLDAGFSNVGVLVEGTKAQIRNGTIRNCNAGVRVSSTGAGQHTIRNLEIVESDHGIRVANTSNTISHNTLRNNRSGISVETANNLVIHNVAIGNGIGIWLRKDARLNRVMFNSATGGSMGFDLSDCDPKCDENTFIGNTATNNSSHGFWVFGFDTVVLGNRVLDNGGLGIWMSGRGPVSGNTVKRNGGGGVFVDGKAILQDNVVKNNGGDGIAIKWSNPNRNIVFANTVARHEAPHHDLVDSTPFCPTLWMDNTFATRSGVCDID